ncbi:unnamed protein product [Cladocopium goreaui]|uniref:Arylsulfatase D (ASD) n=1 Tax=Cladocopium goreaui TaxID=2562237 RepID=A0A9P1BE26_9DINO|nr:unnamed protein product [Cladocopium goreaui]
MRVESADNCAEARKPNLVVIMADDLGAKELGCYGNADHETPRLDAMAAEGIRFRTCYSAPVCSPTRVMIMTGRYGFRTGWNNFLLRAYAPREDSPLFDLGSAQLTFADMLKEQGYATALAGKWQLSGKVPTLIHDCGFDEYCIWAYDHNLPEGVKHTGGREGRKKTARYWHPSIMQNGKYVPTTPEDYGPNMLADFIADFMKRHRDEPFCVYYPMLLTHEPWDRTPMIGKPGKKTPKGLKYNVEYMDHIVGRVLDSIDELGLRDDTVVIFTGDNGTGKSGKNTPTELGARVPLIVSAPGRFAKGVVSDELVDLSDILPTLVDLAGGSIPSDHIVDGHSLVPTLEGEPGEHREWIFSFLGNKQILRDKRWLLEGDGTFFDCGTSRNGAGYKDVSGSNDPEVVAARKRFDEILEGMPVPKDDDPELVPPK